jgi:hypothetical protein
VLEVAWNAMAKDGVRRTVFAYVQGTGKQPSDGQRKLYIHTEFEDYGWDVFCSPVQRFQLRDSLQFAVYSFQ